MPIEISVEVTIPEVLINSEVVRGKIEDRLKYRTGPAVKRLFEKTVQGWSHPVNFYQRSANRPDYVSVTVFTRSKQYGIVNAGAPKHDIPARRGGFVRYQKGYRSSTRPKVISSRAKSYSGPIYSARVAPHPGFEAREFDLAIAEKIGPQFAQDVQEAIAFGTALHT